MNGIDRVYVNEKTQTVRLLDVFVLGPFLMLVGWQQTNLFFRIGLIVSGYATIVYNARNYARNNQSAPIMNALASLPLPEV